MLGLQLHGVELIGRIPQGLPSLTLPEFSLARELWPGALGIALRSFTETIAAARAFAESDEPLIRANRELLATGIANAGGAFLGAMPAGGGTTQSAVNRLAGARTQFAELVTAAVSLATILLLAPLLALMPQAPLAAVVIVYSIALIRPAEFRAILEIRRTEFSWALTALVGAVLLGTLKGISSPLCCHSWCWHVKLRTHQSTFWGASPEPMCFAHEPRSTQRTRLFPVACCCDLRDAFSSPTLSISDRR